MRWRFRLSLIIGLMVPTFATAEPELGGYFNMFRLGIGGLSGIEVADDGNRFQIVTDRGYLLTGEFKRTENARLSQGKIHRESKLAVGQDFDNQRKIDSEAIAVFHDSSLFVAFEQVHQIRRYKNDQNVRIAPPSAARDTHENRGIEALATSQAGTLLAILESVRPKQMEIQIHEYANESWTSNNTIPVVRGYTPSGADMGPDGKLYILERARKGIFFSTLVRRIDLTNGQIETVLKTSWGRHMNTEGIALWRDGQGKMRMIIVSDNNYLPFLPNEVFEYILQE